MLLIIKLEYYKCYSPKHIACWRKLSLCVRHTIWHFYNFFWNRRNTSINQFLPEHPPVGTVPLPTDSGIHIQIFKVSKATEHFSFRRNEIFPFFQSLSLWMLFRFAVSENSRFPVNGAQQRRHHRHQPLPAYLSTAEQNIQLLWKSWKLILFKSIFRSLLEKEAHVAGLDRVFIFFQLANGFPARFLAKLSNAIF